MMRQSELEELIRASPWMLSVLEAARRVDLPDWWIGAGALRDLVWGTRFGHGFDPSEVADVDVAFYDARDVSQDRDRLATTQLRRVAPGIPWEATNQAAVHLWYEKRFGFPVAPLLSSIDGIATWPETATAVGIRLEPDGNLRMTAAAGLADLLDGICRRNPRRVSVLEYQRRIARQAVAKRWPSVTIVEDVSA